MQEGKSGELYEKYRIESEIGRGASGVCYRVQNIRTKEILAMKKIHVTSMKRQSTREACMEVQLLAKLTHPHIIRLHEFFSDEQHLYIVMQYASKGDLHQVLKRRKIRKDLFSQNEVWDMARQLLSALEYLHSRSVIHRDVKTLNIFVDSQSKLYLGDLGVSKILKADCGLYSRVGTPLYLAPEIIRSEKYDHKADIWGLGCVVYQLAALDHPFEGKNIIHLGQNIVGAQPKALQNYSSSLNALVMDMLEKNPLKRSSASELLKKYFQDKLQIPPPIQSKQANKALNSSNVRFEGINKISGGRQLLQMRSNRMKRQIMNNFLDEKLDLIADPIKEEEQRKKKIQTDDLDQTIILAKKGQMPQDAKKYVEATRKTYMISKSENIQSLKSYQQKIKQQQEKEKELRNNFLYFSSQKKFMPPPPVEPAKLSKVSMLPSYCSFQKQASKKVGNTQAVFAQVSRLPSQTSIMPSKARIRPKSSIMSKERHESTMKNIRKNFKKSEIEDLDGIVQTRFLKKPEVIML